VDWRPEVRFADGRPLQILNLESLRELNSRLDTPIDVDRFRANIVYSGQKPFEEDDFSRIQIGNVVFSQPKKCSRCVMTTIDQTRGEVAGPEPLKTLAEYRREGSEIYFGSLWIPENEGVIQQGDSLKVL
jgi:uncharacterized protein YcbX